MSSPFQKSFSAKSPITPSPLKAGGYASGVDGMRYVSPKQPVSKPVARPGKDKDKPKREKLKTVSTLTPEGINIPDPVIETTMPNLGSIEEARVEKKKIPGIKVEKIETNQKKYFKSFEPGFARDPEGTTNIKDYILKKEGKYKPKTIYQNQERTGTTLDGKLVGDMSEWANVGDEYEKN